jgi:hypothetical protein
MNTAYNFEFKALENTEYRFVAPLKVQNTLTSTLTTESTSTTTGSIITAGGAGIAKNLHVGGTGNFTGALNAPVVAVKIPDTTTYNVVATDTHIAIDSSITDTVNLPAGTAGRKITMFNTASSTITINRAGTDFINGATSITLTTLYESVTLLFTAGNWIKI